MLIIVFMIGLAVLVCLPAVVVGFAFGKTPALVVAIVSAVCAVPLVLMFAAYFWFAAAEATPAHAVAKVSGPKVSGEKLAAELPAVSSLGETPPDAAIQAFSTALAAQKIVEDSTARPAWIDQPPGRENNVFRLPVKSGLYTSREECRQALAAAAVQAVVQYGKIYMADADAGDGNVLHHLPADFGAGLIEQPLYAETVQASVGPMQQVSALLEFDDGARAQLREAWRQAAIPRRLRWAFSVFGGVLACIGVLLGALRFDLANGGKYRGRLSWATGLAILLIAGSACGICLL